MHSYCNNKLGVILLGNVTSIWFGDIPSYSIAPFMLPSCCWYIGGGLCCINTAIYPILLKYRLGPRCIHTVIISLESYCLGMWQVSGLETYHLTLLTYQVVVDLGGGLCCINTAIYPILLKYRLGPRCIHTVIISLESYCLGMWQVSGLETYHLTLLHHSCYQVVVDTLGVGSVALIQQYIQYYSNIVLLIHWGWAPRCMHSYCNNKLGVILLGNVTSIWFGDIPSYSIAPFMLPSCCWYIGGGLCCINTAIYPILLKYQVSGLETYHLTLLHHSTKLLLIHWGWALLH